MAIKATNPVIEPITVQVGAIGSEVKSILLNGSRTVADALMAADYNSNCEVRVKGEALNGTDILEDGDVLIVINDEKPVGNI